MAKFGPISGSVSTEAHRRIEAIRSLAARAECPLRLARATAADLGVSERYVYALLRRLRMSGGEFAVLLPTGSRGGPGKSRLPGPSEAIVQAVIAEAHHRSPAPSKAALCREVVERCAGAGVRPPSAATIWRRIMASR